MNPSPDPRDLPDLPDLIDPQGSPDPFGPLDSLGPFLQRHLGPRVDELTPSSGFVLSVMEALEPVAPAPAPIPFPWRRLLPGTLAIVALFLCALRAMMTTPAAKAMAYDRVVDPHILLPLETTLGAIGLALCASALTTVLSFRLAGR